MTQPSEYVRLTLPQRQVLQWLQQVEHSSAWSVGAHLYGAGNRTNRARAQRVLEALKRRGMALETRTQGRWELTEAGRLVLVVDV